MKNPLQYLEQNLPTLPKGYVWRITTTEVCGEHFVYIELYKNTFDYPLDKRSVHVSPTVSRYGLWKVSRTARKMLVDMSTLNSYDDLQGDYASK